MTPIPFMDPQAAYCELKESIDRAVARSMASGWYILGPEVEHFEQEYARYTEASHCITVGNGLEALHLTLVAMGVGPGDEVVVSSNTFIATWLAVTMAGATPVPVEPDPATANLDPARIEAAISSRTRAILPTHLFGQPADLDPILSIARRHSLLVLEDAAQAHGARYKGRRIGGHGDAAAWSFYPAKNLGAFGDGGAVTTNHDALAARIRMLRNYGSREKYVHEVQGFNSRLDPIHAATLAVKLDHLDAWNARRSSIAALYEERLRGTGITLPMVPAWAAPSWHLYVVRTGRRDALQEALRAREIQTLIHYPVPPHLQGAYRNLGLSAGSFPIAEALAETMLSLPMGPHLSLEDAGRVADAVRDWAGS